MTELELSEHIGIEVVKVIDQTPTMREVVWDLFYGVSGDTCIVDRMVHEAERKALRKIWKS